MRTMYYKGFTLLEILLAISILSIIITTVYAAYSGTFRVIKAVDYEDYIYSMARSALKRMTIDMESACPSGGEVVFVSRKNETASDATFMDISFISSARIRFLESEPAGLARITYYVEERKEDEGLVLCRQDVSCMTDIEQEDLNSSKCYIICEKIQSVAYKFYDEKGTAYETWDSGSELEEQKDKIPVLIAVRLEFLNPEDKKNPYVFMTKIFLPLAAVK